MKVYDRFTLDSVLVLLEILDGQYEGTEIENKLVNDTLKHVADNIIEMRKET